MGSAQWGIYMMSARGTAIAGPVVRFRIDFVEHSGVGSGKITEMTELRGTMAG